MDGGTDGLDLIRRLLDQAPTVLAEEGFVRGLRALAEEQRDEEGREQRLRAAVDRLLVDAGRRHSTLSEDAVRKIFESDIDLNAQGLGIWLKRRAKKRQ